MCKRRADSWRAAAFVAVVVLAASGCASPRPSSKPSIAGPAAGTRRAVTPVLPAGRYALSLDVSRSDGCSQTFVFVRTRGQLSVELRKGGVSRLTVLLAARERSGATRRRPGRANRTYVRRWERVYRWSGRAASVSGGFHAALRPVGAGCVHRTLSGVYGRCPRTVPAVVLSCGSATLAQRPRAIGLRRAGASATGQAPAVGARAVLCRLRFAGRSVTRRLPHDLQFLNRPLLLSQQGRPELVLKLISDDLSVQGELIRPRVRPRARPRSR